MEGEPLGRLRADAGQPRERLDQAGDGLDDRAGHELAAAYIPGRRMPPVTAAIFDSASSREAVEGIVDRRRDQVLEHLDVGRDRRPRDRS